MKPLILDEADHMFDKGFLPDIRRILRQCPKERQSLVFSATMPGEIRHLAEDILKNPVTVQINLTRSVDSISHRLYSIDQGQKTDLLLHLLKDQEMATTLVFTRTKYKAKNLASGWRNRDSRPPRCRATCRRANGSRLWTALKAERTPFWWPPTSPPAALTSPASRMWSTTTCPTPPRAYIHRTGRTGRAACTGEALTFATHEDVRMIRLIENSLNDRMSRQTVADLPVARTAPTTERSEGRRERTAAPASRNKGPKGAPNPRAPRNSRPASSSKVFGLRAK